MRSASLAPTLLELGGAKVPGNLHGRSLMPLLLGGAYVPRKSFLVELYSDAVFPRVKNMGYQAVRTERWMPPPPPPSTPVHAAAVNSISVF